MKELQEYIRQTFGADEQLHLEKEKSRKLPLYLRESYGLYSGNLTGRKIIWAEVKNPDSVTPDQLRKQIRVFHEILGDIPVVFVFENLESWQRKRLIEKKVGFAEPFRQLYIPQLFTQLSDGPAKEKTRVEVRGQIKPPAQLLLLYHLQIQKLEEKPLQEIAELLNYSPMTITRSIKELNALALLHTKGAKEKTVVFAVQGRYLWEKALPHLINPVRELWYLDQHVSNDYTRAGGETALAYYSMLAEPQQETIAIGKDAFRGAKTQYGKLDKKYGYHKLEIWYYDPTKLSKGNEVDKLSLYMTLKNHDDERVQGALQNMINEMEW